MGRLATSQSICLVSVGRRPKTVTSTGPRANASRNRQGSERVVIDGQYKFRQNSGVAVCAPAPSLVGQDRA